MKFELQPFDEVDWDLLDGFDDRVFSQRRGWLNFLAETQTGEPVVARLEDGGSTVGCFTGVMIRRMGFRIIGSPFPGWTTPYMGFNLRPGVSRADAVAALIPFVFKELNCQHLEISDPFIRPEDMTGFGFTAAFNQTFRSDLRMSEEELFARIHSGYRGAIRKAERCGVVIEHAEPEGFVDDYFSQLEDVFAKQGLRPNYGRSRVEALIRHVYPSGSLLLLRARDPEGRSIATGISPGFNKTSDFWGSASWRHSQKLRPNQALKWYAMRYWRRRGVQTQYWGDGAYKAQYGGEETAHLKFRLSRHAFIGIARDLARAAHYLPRQLKANLFELRAGRHSACSKLAGPKSTLPRGG